MPNYIKAIRIEGLFLWSITGMSVVEFGIMARIVVRFVGILKLKWQGTQSRRQFYLVRLLNKH